MKRVAVDIGGTFTDCFVCWEDSFQQTKALTTHQNLALGFNEALDIACDQLGVSRVRLLSEVDSVRYGTTLGTNALIERKGPKIGLLITQGFESTVPISRGRGYAEGLPKDQIKDLSRATRPLPIVPINLIRPIRERLDYQGKVLLRIDEAHARRQIRELLDAGVQAIVVNLVNSVANPAHELKVLELFMHDYPPHLLGAIPMLLSHQVSGRKGEYVRASSTIIDAYLHSTMYFAMSALEQNLRDNGYKLPMLLVHNTGGMAQINSTDALQTVHSGPVAGLHAAETLSRQSKMGNLICGDMGGTSFDIGIVVSGGRKFYDFNPVVDRWLVSIPMVHLVSLGAGGGSIARYDPVFNSLRVGPESASSDPGPACYDRGGFNPTVTDADLILGYLDGDNYANGQIKLNRRRALKVFEDICDALNVDAIAAAKLVRQLTDGDMAAGLVRELGTKGYRPSEFVFLAYGGNGPLHACGIADKAGIKTVLAPPFSSVFSACGGAALDQMHIHEKNATFGFYNKSLAKIFTGFDEFNAVVEELQRRGKMDLLRQGLPAEKIQHRVELDMRYSIQKMELGIVIPKTRLANITDVIEIIELFNTEFGKRFGTDSVSTESGVWVTTVRVVSWVELPSIEFGDLNPPQQKVATPPPVAVRPCHFVGHENPFDTPVYDARALLPGIAIDGPAIVNPGATTYLVEPGWRFESAQRGAVWLFKKSGLGKQEVAHAKLQENQP